MIAGIGVIFLIHGNALGQGTAFDLINRPSSLNQTATMMTQNKLKTVFLIVMENHDWVDIKGSSSAPYINSTLLPQASYTTQYYNPRDIHPSEPNYLWLEAGNSFGIKDDGLPSANHQKTDNHLVTLMDKAGISWKSYQEAIDGKLCPLYDSGLYTPRHNPMLYFDNVTNNNDPNSKYCITHVRPFTELKAALENNRVAQYNFITPDLCHSMHNTDGCDSSDSVKNGDSWLSKTIPMIMDSQAYKEGGVIFITWDESESDNGNQPIGMLVLSPLAKGGGYSDDTTYTHSSTLRTIEEIFNLRPILGEASHSNDLRDLFKQFP